MGEKNQFFWQIWENSEQPLEIMNTTEFCVGEQKTIKTTNTHTHTIASIIFCLSFDYQKYCWRRSLTIFSYNEIPRTWDITEMCQTVDNDRACDEHCLLNSLHDCQTKIKRNKKLFTCWRRAHFCCVALFSAKMRLFFCLLHSLSLYLQQKKNVMKWSIDALTAKRRICYDEFSVIV